MGTQGFSVYHVYGVMNCFPSPFKLNKFLLWNLEQLDIFFTFCRLTRIDVAHS